jgi:hypothetical protein
MKVVELKMYLMAVPLFNELTPPTYIYYKSLIYLLILLKYLFLFPKSRRGS